MGELVALLCCDLGGIVRGRSVPAARLGERLEQGVGWVPANSSLTPLGTLAEPNPFGSTGDLRLLPDPLTHVRIERAGPPLELLLCDIVETDGSAWQCCPRRFLREAIAELDEQLGAHAQASFEHEFQLICDEPPPLAFSLDAQMRIAPLGERLVDALEEAGLAPELFFGEFAAWQFELPVGAADALAAADRAVLLRELIREVARRHGARATFAPLLDPDAAGNGVHIHLRLLSRDGAPLLFDPDRPGMLSELAGSFAAGVLAHAPALVALTAPSPVSAPRLAPHRWGAGAAALGVRNREALLRIPPVLSLASAPPGPQLRLEYRGADASANPYLALGALIRAGVAGVRERLPAPPLLEADPTTLEEEQARRFGVGALPGSLAAALDALAADPTARGWMGELLHDAYQSLKRAELAAVEGLDLAAACRRYAHAY